MDFLKPIFDFFSQMIDGDKQPPPNKVTFAAGSDTERNVVPLNAPPEITSELEEDGFIDLLFWIESTSQTPDGNRKVRATGVHKGQTLSFEVELLNWSALADAEFISAKGDVRYLSVGEKSDAFLNILSELYETNLAIAKMMPSTEFTALALSGSPLTLDKAEAKIKLFYEPENAGAEDATEDEEGTGGYAEVFTNIDLVNRRLELREKDPDYRLALLQALSGLNASAGVRGISNER